MTKRNKIIYWVATIWLALGMMSTGIVQLLHVKEEAEVMAALGYPAYFMSILGIWKIAGVIAILIPKIPIVKEWAYAGFFFTMTGALFSHAVVGDEAIAYFGPSLLIVLTLVSWYLRPADRKVSTASL